MNILVIAGEPSGDLHASKLIDHLKENADLDIWGTGGNGCISSGMELLEHVRDLSVMGIWEVLPKLLWFKELERRIVREAQKRRPSAAILVDYPGFNLSIAPKLSALGIPVIYYISPQFWAWKEGRVKKIKRYVDRMIVILPFEREFYKKHGIKVDYVGHPFIDVVKPGMEEAEFRRRNDLGDSPFILLLPGSRRQEFQRHMPLFTRVHDMLSDRIPEYKWRVLLSDNINNTDSHLSGSTIKCIVGDNYSAMSYASFGLITSGSATLEAAVSLLPHFVVYKTSPLTYQIFKYLVKVDRIGLANLVAGKTVSPEFIQGEASPENIANSLFEILSDREAVHKMNRGYEEIRDLLGEGDAAKRAAEIVLETIRG